MQKRIIWIGGAVIVFLLIALTAMIIIKNTRKSPAVLPVMAPQILATPTLPVPTAVPTALPAATTLPGNVWVVSKIEEDATHQNGFVYDVGTFTNLNQPTLTIRAQCMEPGWPSPTIGQQYVMNDYDVLVPIEGINSTLQRFLILK